MKGKKDDNLVLRDDGEVCKCCVIEKKTVDDVCGRVGFLYAFSYFFSVHSGTSIFYLKGERNMGAILLMQPHERPKVVN